MAQQTARKKKSAGQRPAAAKHTSASSTKRKKKKQPPRKLSPKKIRAALLRMAVILGVAFVAGYFVYLFLQPLQLKSESITIPYRSQFNPSSNIRFVFLGSKQDVKVTGDLNVDKIGDYSITYKYKNQKIAVKVRVADLTKPELLLKNLTTDLKQEITPDMLVHKVEDDSKVTVSFEENTNLSGAGKHKVTVVATDEYGNETRAKTIVTRIDDSTQPVITGFDESYTLWQGTSFIADSGVSISDNLDPSPKLSVDSSQVNMSVPGEYTITYTGKDRSGNTVNAEQTVEIKENPEFGQKVVYLTFEYGPSAHTGEILSILEQNDINATFFVSGFNQDFNDWISEAYALGNTIGLGSYIGEDEIYSSASAFWADLKKTEEMVKDLTGETSHLIRFFGGSSNENVDASLMSELIEEANAKGYQYYDWNVDSGDVRGNNVAPSDIIDNSTASDAQYITIRLHDSESKQTTVDALQDIITYYKDLGYKFMPITERSLATHLAEMNDAAEEDTE